MGGINGQIIGSIAGSIMKDPNYELESARINQKYISSFNSKLHFQALERIVAKYNDGSISAEIAHTQIRAINDIRNKYDDVTSEIYASISSEHLELLYLEY